MTTTHLSDDCATCRGIGYARSHGCGTTRDSHVGECDCGPCCACCGTGGVIVTFGAVDDYEGVQVGQIKRDLDGDEAEDWSRLTGRYVCTLLGPVQREAESLTAEQALDMVAALGLEPDIELMRGAARDCCAIEGRTL